MTVKKQFGKEGGIVAYHAYQSFAENEVTAEEAHNIGLEFAKRVWGEKYQVVVATHLNTKCLHNHFVINSISFKDGKRLREKQWYELNKISDEICKSHNLSVIEKRKPQGFPKQLEELEKKGADTRLNVARKAVDEAIAASTNLKEFELCMKSMGYLVNLNPNRKYWTVKMANWQRPIRMNRMGENYCNDKLVERLKEDSSSKTFIVFQKAVNKKREYKLLTREHKIKKIGGLKGLYLHYCYLLGYLPKYKKNVVRVSEHIRDDLIKLEEITEEARYLERKGIYDKRELLDRKEAVTSRIEVIIERRQDLYNVCKRKVRDEVKVKAREEIKGLNKELKELRKEKKIINNIEERTEHMEERINAIEKDVKSRRRERI